MKITTSGGSAAGGGYATVEDEGVPQTQRTTLNFVGGGVSAADVGGKTVVTITGSASGSSGITTIDFGAFPGSSDTSVEITGQAGIIAGSLVNAWLVATATADHSVDEHRIESVDVMAGNIQAGTGFTVYAQNVSQQNEPLETISGNKNQTVAGGLVQSSQIQNPRAGGRGTRIYGLWTVAWQWS